METLLSHVQQLFRRAHVNLRAKCFLSRTCIVTNRPTIEILRQDCSAEQHAHMTFFVSDGADFSAASVNFSHRFLFGARSMETHHREVGYTLLLSQAFLAKRVSTNKRDVSWPANARNYFFRLVGFFLLTALGYN